MQVESPHFAPVRPGRLLFTQASIPSPGKIVFFASRLMNYEEFKCQGICGCFFVVSLSMHSSNFLAPILFLSFLLPFSVQW